MSRPFANYSANVTFSQIFEPLDASEYIRNKKAKYTFCSPNICHPNKNIYSQSNYLLLKRANNLAFYPCINEIDKTQLYINLLTKLDLSYNFPVISNINGGTYPVEIDPTSTTPPYLVYNVDPSGNLFGNDQCGPLNFENYLVYNPPSNPENL